jgi:hypothetical protein
VNTDDEIKYRALAMERPEDRRQREQQERDTAAAIAKATEPRGVKPHPTVSDDDTRVIDDPEAPAMRLDLDYLERKARAATPGPWSACSANDGNCPCRTVWSKPLDESPFRLAPSEPGESVTIQDWNFVAAVNPATMLALIARIRELETFVESIPDWFLQTGKLGREGLPALFADDDGNALYMDEAKCRILERGVVLP